MLPFTFSRGYRNYSPYKIDEKILSLIKIDKSYTMKATLFSLAFICLCVLVSCQQFDQIYDAKSKSIITLTRRDVLQNVAPPGSVCDTPDGGPGNGVCNGNGVCVNDTTTNYTATCICNDEHTGPECAYVLKQKVTAFVLSFLVGGYGADRFYLGYTGLGSW